MANYKEYVGLGIAGNFALHLEQAGESEDFKDILTEDPNAPKGMFPFYLPNHSSALSIYPISSDTITLPDEEVNVQAEPEVGLVCEFTYKDGLIIDIKPTHFGAYNDCSLRKKGASKISHKKNWGVNSKGLSEKLIELDSFSKGSNIEKYRICSFLRRNGDVYRYGEDVEISGYTYFYEQLIDWIKKQLNTQIDVGPLEAINAYLREIDYPTKAVISIGATRYTPYGESTFLKSGDEVIVVLYDNDLYCKNPIFSKVVSNSLDEKGIISLVQKVI